MAYVILITAPGSAPVAYGPEKDFAAAELMKERLVAQEEGLTGTVTALNSMDVAESIAPAVVAG